MKEQVSVLIDGEANDLERERVLRGLRDDDELLKSWERYHLVRTALRRELDFVAGPELANRVRERIASQVPDLAPGRLKPRVVKLAAGFAIAASVATVALLNLTPIIDSPAQLTTARLSSSPPASQTTVAEARPLPPERQRVLNPYLVHHAEFSSATSVNTMSAYARVVGRDQATPDSASAAE